MIAQLAPLNFAAWLSAATAESGRLPTVLDVREPWELAVASVRPEGFALLHVPMQSIPAQLPELLAQLGAEHPIACLCHHGVRSLNAATYLAQNGFGQVVNVQGGIQAWAQQFDPTVAQY